MEPKLCWYQPGWVQSIPQVVPFLNLPFDRLLSVLSSFVFHHGNSLLLQDFQSIVRSIKKIGALPRTLYSVVKVSHCVGGTMYLVAEEWRYSTSLSKNEDSLLVKIEVHLFLQINGFQKLGKKKEKGIIRLELWRSLQLDAGYLAVQSKAELENRDSVSKIVFSSSRVSALSFSLSFLFINTMATTVDQGTAMNVDVDNASTTAAPIVGMIYPPPDIRSMEKRTTL